MGFRVSGLGFRVQGLRVWGLGFGVSGLGFGVQAWARGAKLNESRQWQPVLRLWVLRVGMHDAIQQRKLLLCRKCGNLNPDQKL